MGKCFFFFFFFFVSNVLISYPDTKAKYELGVFGVTFPCKGHRRGKYVVARKKWGEGVWVGGGRRGEGRGNPYIRYLVSFFPTFIFIYGFHFAYELTRSVG